MEELAGWIIALIFFLPVLLAWNGTLDEDGKKDRSMPLVDLTMQEMERIQTLLELQRTHGVVAPEDQALTQKLGQYVSQMAPRTNEQIVRGYRDPFIKG